MTTQFHTEETHAKGFALLFDSHKIEAKFNEKVKGTIPYSIIKDKEENRLSSMLHSVGEIGAQFITLQMAAVSAIAIARSSDEAALMQLGFLKLVPSGIAICPTCLAKAIATCEENLIVLRDIQEAVKNYG